MQRLKDWRIFFLIAVVLLLSGTIFARLFSLQILKYDLYGALAQDQYQFFQELFPARGEIFIQDLKSNQKIPLAINKEYHQVYAVPVKIPNDRKEELSKQLASILQIDEALISSRINKENDPYEPLKHKVDDAAVEAIRELNVEGIELAPEISRLYPGSNLASHIVGFVGMNDDIKAGQYGLESYYEDELKGSLGSLAGEKDTIGRWIPTANQDLTPAQDGPQIVLTIDQNIQFKVEKELKEVVEKYQAKSGTVIVMEPEGAIRAMASYPNYDPNNYAEVEDIDVYINPAVQKIYEPGSVFKAITMAAGLDSGKLKEDDIFDDTGPLSLAGGVIRNVNNTIYGFQTMAQILESSINTGAVYVQQETGQEIFRDYVQKFGFGQPTGVGLNGELGGNINNLTTKREIDFATASFGQGIAVTPLQMINAFAAIANQGKLMQPYIVAKKIYPDGREEIAQPQEMRQAISVQSAHQLTKMLVAVVDSGHGTGAQVKGYSIAGKTGTAEVPSADGPGYSEETIQSFIGFAPAFDPRFVILVKIEKPIGVLWAATSVTPVFSSIAEYLLNYFEIPPK